MIDYGFDEEKANYLITVQNLSSLFLMPLVGLFSDRFGYRQSTLILTNLVQLGLLAVPLFVGTCDQCGSIKALFYFQGMC